MLVLCVAMLLGALTPSTIAAQTSPPLDAVVADLNADCVADTVRVHGGGRSDTASLQVHWGKRDSTPSCDDAWYLQGNRTYRSITTLRLAGVSGARYSVFAVTNNNDSYRDLVVSARGTVRKVIGDDTLKTDTTFTVVVYAQRGLDTLGLIDFDNKRGQFTMA